MNKQNLSDKYYRFHNSIQLKFLLYMLVSAGIVFAALLSYNYFYLRSALENNADLRAVEITKHIVSASNSFLSGVVKITKGVEMNLWGDHLKDEDLERLLKDVVLDNEEIYACRVGFEPGISQKDAFSLLTVRSDELHPSLQTQIVADDFHLTDEYKRAISRNESFFSSPHTVKELDGISVLAYIMPISSLDKEKNQVIKGAVCMYVSVNWFNQWLKKQVDFEDGFVAVMGPETEMIAYNNHDMDVEGKTLLSIAEKGGSQDLKMVVERIKNKETGFIDLPLISMNDQGHLSFKPLQVADWSVAVLLSDKKLFKDLHKVYSNIVKLGAVGLVFLILMFYLVIRRITRPLSRLADSTNLVAIGNFDIKLPLYEKKDEVGRLTYSMQMMINRLKIYFEEMREKERLEGELRVAREIQNTIIPHEYPAFPQERSIDVYGMVRPAKEIGGDFFDYVLCRERYLFFVVGDVSGTGVPASLLMAVTRTLFRTNACTRDTGEMASRINKELCQGNKSNMFVTLFVGILDIYTGFLRYTNAGHNYPFLKKADGEVIELKENHGIPVGMLDTLVYRSGEYQMLPDDMLVMYTDGVNEARQSESDSFGVTGVEEYLKKISEKKNAREITEGLITGVESYTGGGNYYKDDITVLTVKYEGYNEDGNR